MNPIFSGINVTQPPFFKDPFLVAVSVIIRTLRKDKDHDTLLDISVLDHEGILVAEKRAIGGHWIEKTSYLISLDIKNTPTKVSLKCSTLFKIHPNGRDEWHFNADVMLFFSDGTSAFLKLKELALSNDTLFIRLD